MTIKAPHIRRGRRPTPGAARGVSAQAVQMVQAAKDAIESAENKMFAEMYASALERKVYHNDSALFDFMKHLVRTPVSIDEFIESEEFLGATDIDLWPEVRQAILDINRNWWKGLDPKSDRGANHEALLMGSTGSGKSEIGKITQLYHFYLLTCLDNPQRYYGLPSATSIVFVIMAAKPHVTKKVLYMPMRKMVEDIPYFQKHARFDKYMEAEMVFPDWNIRIVPGGSDADAILGEAIISGIIDEINFMNVVLKSKKAEVSTGRSGIYDQAQTIHSAVTRRIKGRFTKPGPRIGVLCTASSTRYKGDFTDKRKASVIKYKERGVYIYDRPQYEVKPADRFCGEKFRLLVGNDIIQDTRILKDTDAVPDGARVLNIPVEYLSDFQQDPHSALRDICGISTSSISPFFKRRFKILEAISAGEEDGLESFLHEDNVILGVHDMPRVKFGHYCQNPSRPRYVHIDLSTTGDRCVAKGQPVLMADGRYVPIERVRVGDLVVTHEGAHEPVTRIFDNGHKDILEVGVYGWPAPLRATSTHKVWAVRRSAISYADGRLVKPSDPMFTRRSGKAAKGRYSYVPSFVELGDLRPGDFLVTPRRQTVDVSNLAGVPLTYETGYIAGLFAAEGSYYLHRGAEYVQFSLHEDEIAIRKNLDEYLQTYFGLTTRACRDKKNRGVTLRTRLSNELSMFLRTAVGEYSHHKHLDCAHVGPGLFRAGVAHGYVDGDGCVRYDDAGQAISFRTKSVSHQMAHAFYWLLVDAGFAPSIGVEDAYTDTRGVHHRTTYHVSLSGPDSMRSFAAWSHGHVDVPCSRIVALPDYNLVPITDMHSGGESQVYDLTVGSSHSYIVGNTAVHNCGIAMVRFDGMQDVTRGNGVVEKLPLGTVELACSIEPDANNEIQFSEVRTWVKQLKDLYGYPIKSVTYDGVFSIESIQQWRKQGMKTGHISVDKTSVPYKTLRDCFHDGRLKMYQQDVLVDELFELEYDEDKDKIDHPVKGSKDVADAVCGAYYSMVTRRASWTQAAEDDESLTHSDRPDPGDRADLGARR